MNQQLKDEIVAVIDAVDDMTVATVREDGFPQATTVSFVNDGLTLYFGTSTTSQKAANIGRDGRVSLTLNRPYDTWDEIVGLSIGGHASAVDDPAEREKFAKLVLEKFPEVANYVGSEEDLAVFRIDPTIVSLLDYTEGFGHTERVDLRSGAGEAAASG